MPCSYTIHHADCWQGRGVQLHGCNQSMSCERNVAALPILPAALLRCASWPGLQAAPATVMAQSGCG